MRLATLLRAAMLASARGPIGRIWIHAHLLLARAVALWLGAGTQTSVLLRGSFASREAVPGLSDIDLLVVTSAPERRRALALSLLALRRLRMGFLARHVSVFIYSEAELRAALGSTFLDVGLDDPQTGDPRSRAILLAPAAPADEVALRERPPLGDPRSEWALLRGPDVLPAHRAPDPEARATAAWLELQYWWRHAFRLASDPGRLDAGYMAFKLVAGPATALFHATGEEPPGSRTEAVERLGRDHGQAEAAEYALGLWARVPRREVVRLDPVLLALTRVTERVAALQSGLAPDAEEVELIGDGVAGHAAALIDWRALCYPASPDERFTLAEGHPGRAADLVASRGEQPLGTLRANSVLVTPGSGTQRFRGAASPVTDPVSFALLEGAHRAAFPALRGWSAHDRAQRAVAEHRAWLWRRATGSRWVSPRGLGLVLTAARAGLFLDSIRLGEPALAVTTEGVLAQAETLHPAAAERLRAGAEELAACEAEGREPDDDPALAAEDAVGEMAVFGTREPAMA